MIAICLGGATTVWKDLESATALLGDRPHLVIACNLAGQYYAGHLAAWVTLHPEVFPSWRSDRASRGWNTDYRAFCCPCDIQTDAEIVPDRYRGSSGLYMAQIALEELDASGAILCGVPMDGSGSHIHWGGAWSASDRYRSGFVEAYGASWPMKSMSGWTADLFGKPDAAWIAQIEKET